MAERRPSLMEPRIETLMNKVDSKFTLVTLASKRGRQINSYFHNLGEGGFGAARRQTCGCGKKGVRKDGSHRCDRRGGGAGWRRDPLFRAQARRAAAGSPGSG